MVSRINAHYLMEAHMDEVFWLGQIFWLTFFACGAYLSFAFFRLADEGNARTATPAVPPATHAGLGKASFEFPPLMQCSKPRPAAGA